MSNDESAIVVMVDEFMVWPGAHGIFKRGSCHLTVNGDTAKHHEALHLMAHRVGMKRSWFQPHRTHPHYDLVKSRREAALKAGAVFVPAREQARERLARHPIGAS